MTIPATLDRSFRARAAAEGLIDVAVAVVDSPVGALTLAATTAGLCAIAFDHEESAVLERFARDHGARVLRYPPRLDAAARELDEYFAGRRRAFELAVDTTRLRPFQRAVLGELARVPYGAHETYGGLAGRIGRPTAARAVGRALNTNPIPIVLPCHRILGADGKLVGYAGGLERKRTLLALEAGQSETTQWPAQPAGR